LEQSGWIASRLYRAATGGYLPQLVGAVFFPGQDRWGM